MVKIKQSKGAVNVWCSDSMIFVIPKMCKNVMRNLLVAHITTPPCLAPFQTQANRFGPASIGPSLIENQLGKGVQYPTQAQKSSEQLGIANKVLVDLLYICPIYKYQCILDTDSIDIDTRWKH